MLSTRNGAKTLPVTLESMQQLEVPEGGWKLIVVDNGSADNSAEIIHRFMEELPLTYVYEGRPGKNRALNAGLPFAEGDLIIFTDDDVVVQPHWLKRYRQSADAHPDIDIFCGLILPKWPRTPDAWIVRSIPLGPAFAVHREGLRTGEIDPGFAWGPNMAIRSEIFEAGERFSESIGPDGTSNYIMGSETEFTTRLKKKGHKCWMDVDNSVEHIIRENQLDKRWILNRARRGGRGAFNLTVYSDNLKETPTFLAAPRWMWRMAATHYLCSLVFRLGLGTADRAMRHAWKYNVLIGQICAARRRKIKITE